MTTKTEQASLSDHSNNHDNPGGPSKSKSLPHSPRPHAHGRSEYHGTWCNGILDPDDVYELEPLKDPTGHLDYKDVNPEEPALIIDLDVPSTLSLAKIAKHSQIKAQCNEALTKGLKVVDKAHLLNATLATQRLFYAVFPEELDLLNNIFTRAQKWEWFLTGSGYRLIIDHYKVLLRVLYNLRLMAEDSFHLVGRCLPKMPSWGNDDDLEEYWNVNDFEILAVCF
ncbi:hypothetical protein C8R46DRAFT_1219558 [Mycena filopes]|nr:hypothetical protein C8R46DRAFT_1219558 [Mycena filopes]